MSPQLSYFTAATGSPYTPTAVAGTLITVSSTTNLSAGMYVESALYNINTTITNINSSTQFTVASGTNITTSTPLTIGSWVTAVVGAQGAQGPSGLSTIPIVNITAAGSSQGTATLLTMGAYNVVSGPTATTNGGAGTGVILPPITSAGQTVFIDNGGSEWLLLYPASGGSIDNASTNGAIWLAPSAYWFGVAETTTNWSSTIPSLNTDATGAVAVNYVNGQITFGLNASNALTTLGVVPQSSTVATATQTVASTSATNITALALPLTASNRFRFESEIFASISTTSATAIGVTLTVPAGASVNYDVYGLTNSTTAKQLGVITTNTLQTGFVTTSGFTGFIKVAGSISMGTTTGSVQMQLNAVGTASSVAATATVQSGSYLIVTQI